MTTMECPMLGGGKAGPNLDVGECPATQLGHRRNDVCLRSPLRFQCVSLNGRQPLCNGREEALHFFPQVRDRVSITREMPQQASLEQSIKQRIEGAPGDNRLSAAK